MGELTPERIFALHPKIRWAGLATDQGEVLFTKMRPGISSISPEEADRPFMQLGPMLLSGVCERLTPWAGPLEAVVGRYAKVVLIVTKLDKRFLALTLDRADTEILGELMPALLTLKS